MKISYLFAFFFLFLYIASFQLIITVQYGAKDAAEVIEMFADAILEYDQELDWDRTIMTKDAFLQYLEEFQYPKYIEDLQAIGTKANEIIDRFKGEGREQMEYLKNYIFKVLIPHAKHLQMKYGSKQTD